MDLELSMGQSDVEDDGDAGVLHVNVSVTEPDGVWRNTGTGLPTEDLTPDAVADAMVHCLLAAATMRGPATLIALQQRLLAWGQGQD